MWINDQEEPSTQTKYITLKNNGISEMDIRVLCITEPYYHVGVDVISPRDICLEPYTSQIVGIIAHCDGRIGALKTNSDFGKVRVELVTYFPTEEYTTIVEFPIRVKVSKIESAEG